MTENELVDVEVFIVMNQDGEHVVSHDLDNATEFFNGDYSGPAVEVTKIIIKMRPPKSIAREATATLPDDATGGEVTLTLNQSN